MSKRERLFQIADRQQGFFTAKQAESCGYHRSNFHLKVRSGEWIQEGRGIYRLGQYPITSRSELVLWHLWSRNNCDVPQGVWSHETALDIHELSDIMPSKMHMTVPSKFRRSRETPEILRLYREELASSDIEERQGYKVTTPLRTIADCIVGKSVADNFIKQAIEQAFDRGLISEQELQEVRKILDEGVI